MNKKSLVIGASGQVGEHLVCMLRESHMQVTGTYYINARDDFIPLDVQDKMVVRYQLTDIQPEVIYVPASLTHVDYCEQHPEESYSVNVIGVQNVVKNANEIGAKVVYFSSDYIFDGKDGPYSEDATASPISVYGRQKLMAEHYISLWAQDYLIIRTTVVYGWETQGKNFVYRLIKTLRQKDVLQVPEDQIGSPTYAPDLARATIQLVQNDARGVFNVVGRERARRYDFALAAAEVFGLDPQLLKPVRTLGLKQAAPRPLNAGLTVDKVESALGRKMLDYREGLKEMARSMECYL